MIERADPRPLVDFIAIGPPRTGSTWLHGLLMRRARLPLHLKETWYFDRYYDKGPSWYASQFSDRPLRAPVGEVSPTYFGAALARERISRDVPDCRIICVLRDPVARAWSWYRMRRRIGMARHTFEAGLFGDVDPILRETNQYASRIREWRAAFPSNRFAVFLYDDLVADPQRFADSITDFLALERIAVTPDLARHLQRNEASRDCRFPVLALNAHRLRRSLWRHRAGAMVNALERAGFWRLCFDGGRDFPLIDAALEARARRYYRAEIEELEPLIERDLSSWKLSADNR